MTWRYQSGRLLVWDSDLDFVSVRRVIRQGMIPNELRAIVYQIPGVTYVVTGAVLRSWLSGRID